MIRKGYDIHLSGHGDLAKLLTKLKSKGTKISSLTVHEGVARFQTDQKGIRLIRKYRRKYGVKAKISYTGKDPGLATLFRSYRYMIAVIIPFACSFFLWTVNVESDMPEVAERIEEKLESASIARLRPLALIPDEDEIRRNLMQDDPSLSWVRFKRIGTSLTVIPMLSPASDAVPEEEGPPADLVARTGGVVTRFALTKGERVGFVHSTVKKGDVLATGTLEQGEKKVIVGAAGAVFADYWVTYDFSISKIMTYKVQGKEEVEFRISLPWKDETNFPNSFWRFVTIERHASEEEKKLELAPGMEKTIIIPLLRKKLLEDRETETIIKEDKVLHVTFDDDKVKGTILFLVNDNIAVKRPISKGD